jgi:hypothetical protein
MANLLKRLISDEVGTSAFLATLLDPRYDHNVFVQARAAIAMVLRKHGVEFSAPAPTVVELEYLNIDLVAVWPPWTILIENKVALASVTRGQLNDYYAVALLQLARNGFLKHAGEMVSLQPLCFVYLTPSLDIGMVEFYSLALDPSRRDIKKHIAWEEILDGLTPLVGKADGHASWFLDAGVDCVRKVLDAAKNAGLLENIRRSRLQALMNKLKSQLRNNELVLGFAFHRWSDQSREQLFAAGPTRSAYVGLYLSYDGSDFPSSNTVRAVGDISFDVASKHRVRLRDLVTSKSLEEWAAVLGVASGEIYLNPEKGSLSWRFALPEMSTEKFLSAITERLAAFFSVFMPILAEAVDLKTDQSDN